VGNFFAFPFLFLQKSYPYFIQFSKNLYTFIQSNRCVRSLNPPNTNTINDEIKNLKLFTLALLFFSVLGFAQNKSDNEESLIAKMCKEFKNSENLADSIRIGNMYDKRLNPFLMTLEPAKVDSLGTAIYLRLQKQCKEFRQFLLLKSGTEHWQIVETMPKSELTKSQKKDFQKASYF
jgi:hypothetical protein